MAVQEGPSFKRYAANGIATVYSIPFLLLSGEDLVVTLDGVMITSGITLTGVGNPTSTATFNVAPNGDLLFLLMVPFQRLTDYQENGDLLSRTLNNDIDRIWLALKELRRDDQRALSVNPLEPEGIPPLPVAALRQGRLLAFDEDGDPIPSNLTLTQLEEQPALALASAAEAQASAEMAGLSETAAGGYANAASASAGTAVSAAILAGKWAEEAEDVPVTTVPNKYSAKHWAAKAAAALSGVVASVAALAARVTTLEGIFSKKYVIPAQAITFGGTINITHGLAVEPKGWRLKLRCTTATLGFSVGHVIALPDVADGYSSSTGTSVRVDATNMRINIATSGFWVIRDDTKAAALITANQWEVFGEIWAS